MSKTTAQKMAIRPGHTLLVINPPESYSALIGELPAGVRISSELSAPFDVAHIFIRNRADLERLYPTINAQVKPGHIVWISYPKSTSKVDTDINRDSLWPLLTPYGMQPNMQIAIDETWSALRFKHADPSQPSRFNPA